MPDPRQNIAYTLAQRAQAARQGRQAAMPAPAQRPTDPVTGGFLPPPPRQGDALDQMYAQSAQRVRGQGGPPMPGAGPAPFNPAYGPTFMPGGAGGGAAFLPQAGGPTNPALAAQPGTEQKGPGGPPMPGGGAMAGKGPGAGGAPMPPPGVNAGMAGGQMDPQKMQAIQQLMQQRQAQGGGTAMGGPPPPGAQGMPPKSSAATMPPPQ